MSHCVPLMLVLTLSHLYLINCFFNDSIDFIFVCSHLKLHTFVDEWWTWCEKRKELVWQDLHVELMGFHARSEKSLDAMWRLAGVQSISLCQPWISAWWVFSPAQQLLSYSDFGTWLWIVCFMLSLLHTYMRSSWRGQTSCFNPEASMCLIWLSPQASSESWFKNTSVWINFADNVAKQTMTLYLVMLLHLCCLTWENPEQVKMSVFFPNIQGATLFKKNPNVGICNWLILLFQNVSIMLCGKWKHMFSLCFCDITL